MHRALAKAAAKEPVDRSYDRTLLYATESQPASTSVRTSRSIVSPAEAHATLRRSQQDVDSIKKLTNFLTRQACSSLQLLHSSWRLYLPMVHPRYNSCLTDAKNAHPLYGCAFPPTLGSCAHVFLHEEGVVCFKKDLRWQTRLADVRSQQ